MSNPFWSDVFDAVLDGADSLLDAMDRQHQQDVISDQLSLNASMQQFNDIMRFEQMDSLRSRL